MKRARIKIIGGALLAALATAAVCSLFFARPAPRPTLTVTGDVENELHFRSADGGVPLADLLEKAAPFSPEYSVVVRGGDGLLARVKGDETDGMAVAYGAENGWEMRNAYHPPSSNIKHIAEIWVVCEGELPEHSVSVISEDEVLAVLSPGQMFLSRTEFEPVFQGTSVRETGERSYEVTVYTEKRLRAVADIAPGANDVLVMGAEGQYGYDPAPGTLALFGNSIQYIFSNGRTAMEHVRGVLINPPSASNMDAYREAANNVDLGERVMVFLVDGFGYHQYLYAIGNGYAPGLAAGSPAVKATSEYRPVTNTGLAAMLTGRPPFENGIWNRSMSDLLVPDVFAYAAEAGKTAAYIEGNVKIVDASLEPRLNADRNGNGTDDEVFESAKEAILNGADLIFVHFHGVDDAGHTHGDLAAETMEKIREVDSYIAQLAEGFHGTVIVTADHGMHKDGDAGSHGLFRPEDIIIPYLSYYRGE